jgi:hypothetical protein
VSANALAVLERAPVRPLSVRLEQQLVRTAYTGFKATTTLFVPQGCVEENEIEGEGFVDQDGATTSMNPPPVFVMESSLSSDPVVSSTETSISMLVSAFFCALTFWIWKEKTIAWLIGRNLPESTHTFRLPSSLVHAALENGLPDPPEVRGNVGWLAVSDPVNPISVKHLAQAKGIVGTRETKIVLLVHGCVVELVIATVDHPRLSMKKGLTLLGEHVE